MTLNQQADCILVVAVCDQDSSISSSERALISMKITARKELVLLHPNPVIQTGVTREWLKPRSWIHTHHHIQLSQSFVSGNASMRKRKNPFEDLKSQFEKFARIYVRQGFKRNQFTPKNTGARGDLARLARRLAGRAVGLVCGGGGARGIAHVGVIQAFEEAGIPIDMVGGVSIGSLIGGFYAHTEDIWFTYWRAKEFSNRTSSMWRQLLDLTYPVTSMFTGHECTYAKHIDC
jgi:lysophospholipid hydrolase